VVYTRAYKAVVGFSYHFHFERDFLLSLQHIFVSCFLVLIPIFHSTLRLPLIVNTVCVHLAADAKLSFCSTFKPNSTVRRCGWATFFLIVFLRTIIVIDRDR
jgi:hypothetical protein